jgi:hypothetical protein
MKLEEPRDYTFEKRENEDESSLDNKKNLSIKKSNKNSKRKTKNDMIENLDEDGKYKQHFFGFGI